MRYLIYSAALLATNLTGAQSLDSRIALLEDQMNDLRVEMINGNFGPRTASAYPALSSWGAYASIEGLYLKFTEGGTDYAFEENAGSSILYNGRMKYLDFDWRFAFRVTAGYQFDNPDWDTWAEYMRFATTQTQTTSAPLNGSVDTNIYPLSATVLSAKTKIRVSYNVADWNFGRNFFLRKNFSMHPFVGVRGSWIIQHIDNPMTTTNNTIALQQKNDSWGVGLRGGSQIRWHLSKNWSAFGSAAASLMFTDFSNDALLYRSTSGINTTLFQLNLGDRHLLPNTTLDAGISWEMPFARDRSRVRLSAGYEFNYWWRQNQTLHFNSGTQYSYFLWSEDLALQGVKLNAAFDF